MRRTQLMGVAVLLLLVMVFLAVGREAETMNSLPRPELGQSSKKFDLHATLIWNGEEYRYPITLRVQPEQVQKSEKEQLLAGIQERIKAPLLDGNPAMDQISAPLKLLRQDPKTGVSIRWNSSKEEIVDSQGNIWTLGLTQRTPVTLTASVTVGEEEHHWEFDLLVLPPTSPDLKKRNVTKQQEQELEHLLQQIVTGLERNSSGDSLILPATLPGDVTMQWHKPTSSPGVLLLIPLLVWLWSAQRKREHSRKLQLRKQGLLTDYYNLLDQLVLLLNAGLVVQSALTKITQDYETHRGPGRTRLLYEELSELQQRIRFTKTSLESELQQLGKSTELLELNRFAAILSDHLHRGSSLVEKLEAEQRLLWFQRKKVAEERGKLADTKLVVPMMLQLLAVILISIAPVLMELD